MEKLIEYINTLDLPISEEMFNRHWSEWRAEPGFKDKSGYSNRANIDSEYLEEMVLEKIEGAEEAPDKFYADVKYKGMIIDFKEIASYWYNLQHDYMRYMNALNKGLLTHFLFFKSNRLRYEKNMPDVIPEGFELKFKFLGIYDVNTVMSGLEKPHMKRVNVYNLGDNYGRRIDY